MKSVKSYDFFGHTAIVNFPENFNLSDKKKFALNLMKKQKSIKTVLEKSGNVKGRLRKPETKFIAGENTKEVFYKENNCVFYFDVDKTYFSPRLSNERKEISSLIKKDEEVLVLFAGVAPFSIVIAKNSKAKKIYSSEINREANKYAKKNIELNKIGEKVELVSGDARKLSGKLKKKFDVVVMARPQLKDMFLEVGFNFVKKGGRIYYYDFCKVDEVEYIVGKIKEEAAKAKKKIKILKKKKAGELAPYKIRLRVDLQVLG